MALTTYTELKAAVGDWLNRTDLATPIADFVTLAEAEMKRRIRRTTNSQTIYIYAETTAIPADCASILSLHLNTGSASQDLPLRLCTPEMLAETRARNQAVAGRPTDYAFYEGYIFVQPTPDQSYDAILVYHVQLTPLSGSVATNAILIEAPDAYLYGALLQAAPYLEHDERIPVWQAKFDAAIDQLNKVRDEESYGGGMKSARLPVVFG